MLTFLCTLTSVQKSLARKIWKRRLLDEFANPWGEKPERERPPLGDEAQTGICFLSVFGLAVASFLGRLVFPNGHSNFDACCFEFVKAMKLLASCVSSCKLCLGVSFLVQVHHTSVQK